MTALSVSCPTCMRLKGQPCISGGGRTKSKPHESRATIARDLAAQTGAYVRQQLAGRVG